MLRSVAYALHDLSLLMEHNARMILPLCLYRVTWIRFERTCVRVTLPLLSVGQRFALMSTTLALAALCRRFEFSLPEDFECNLELLGTVLLRPKGGLPMFLKERASA